MSIKPEDDPPTDIDPEEPEEPDGTETSGEVTPRLGFETEEVPGLADGLGADAL